MELEINGKIVSLKHFLNKRLKPLFEEETPDAEPGYPLYTQVIFDKESTKFKANTGLRWIGPETVYFSESKEQYLDDDNYIREFEKGVFETDKKILKIVEYEVNKYNDKFTLKGLGKRLSHYGTPITDFIATTLRNEFFKFAGDYLTYNQYISLYKSNESVENLIAKAIDSYSLQYNSFPKKLALAFVFYHLLATLNEKEGYNSTLIYHWFILPETKNKFKSKFRTLVSEKELDVKDYRALVNLIDDAFEYQLLEIA